MALQAHNVETDYDGDFINNNVKAKASHHYGKMLFILRGGRTSDHNLFLIYAETKIYRQMKHSERL